jgi:hypothetical protein
MRNGVAALVGALFLLPAVAGAQVIISEIMYDLQIGSDSGREWIEVFNAGANPVRLVDWRLYEANTNHAITAFSGGDELPSGGYAIIADSPSKFTEDWPSYTGALFDSAFSLSNGGETIGIHTPSPEFQETDSVSFQSAWGANGDGNTLQRAASDGASFSAAAPTPGTGPLALIPGLSYAPPEKTEPVEDKGAASSSPTASAPTPAYVPPPLPQLFADAGGDRTVIVGADTEFDGRAYNRDDQLLEKVRFLWNFGDGSTAEGPAVLHHFEYPGRYAVILAAAAEKESMVDKVIVTAEPARLSFAVNADGSVTIENRAGRDLDLSRWLVRSFLQVFTLPEHTIILAGAQMRIPKQTLKFVAGLQTELAYPNGVVALRANESSVQPSSQQTVAPVVASGRSQASKAAPQAARPNAPAPKTPLVAVQTAEAADAVEKAETAEEPAMRNVAAASVSAPLYWWLALAALIALGAGALVYIRRTRSEEWDITEA